jgi:hypothetical protein
MGRGPHEVCRQAGTWPVRETGTFSRLLDHSDRQYLLAIKGAYLFIGGTLFLRGPAFSEIHRAAGRGLASGRKFTNLSSQQTIPAEKPSSTPIVKSSTCCAKFSLDTQRRALLYSRPSEASSYHLTAGDRHPHLSPQRHDRRC